MIRILLVSGAIALAAATPFHGPAAAQSTPQPERATFYILVGNDTLGKERSTRTATSVDGEYLGNGGSAHVAYHLDLAANGLINRMTVSSVASNDRAAQPVVVTFTGDSVVVESNGRTTKIAAGAGAMPNFNPSAVLFEQMLIRARMAGGPSLTIPAFYPNANQTVPTTVAFAGPDSALLTVGGVTMRLAVSPQGRLLGGDVPAQRVRLVRGPPVDSFAVKPPDYRAPSGAPYTAEEVVVRTPTGVSLAGTLTVPNMTTGGRVPAVVTITGSGPENRDEDLPGVDGYHPFRQIADTLGRRGIAVLRLDDRGVGGSSGPAKNATSADFAEDIGAAVAFLRTRPDIDGARVGLIGHSEGGLIAPMVAAKDPTIRAIVLLAGPSRTGRKILEYQRAYAVDSMLRVPAAKRDSALGAMTRALDSTAATDGWVRFFLDYDPAATARRVRAPVLILQGANDRQVTPDQATELAKAFRAGGNRDVTIHVFPATDHLFLRDSSGNPSGYRALPSKRISGEIMGAIADWLATEFRR